MIAPSTRANQVTQQITAEEARPCPSARSRITAPAFGRRASRTRAAGAPRSGRHDHRPRLPRLSDRDQCHCRQDGRPLRRRGPHPRARRQREASGRDRHVSQAHCRSRGAGRRDLGAAMDRSPGEEGPLWLKWIKRVWKSGPRKVESYGPGRLENGANDATVCGGDGSDAEGGGRGRQREREQY